ncbi:hypothetical protein EKPJFOCH_2952 [Methylobacterium thuringiense]|uniref:O-antigen ligase-related domain-containing protein n=2 Tax=Methylobacterium thuringiense TaxID=1003091 RepID=A0ABQ4TP72_9HYPH|nr:hypothetical protein EKPJFOCH_2952 [Methylobacterium thuringiense]
MSAAKGLYAAGAVALALVPPAMALANRSSPLVVVVAALLFGLGVAAEEGRGALRLLLRPLGGAVGAAVLGFLAWCLLSFAWSPFPALSLRTLSEFGPTLVAAYCLARLAPGRLPPWTPPLAAGALVVACLFVVASLRLGMAPQRLLGQRDALFVFNRPVLTFVLVAGPLAFLVFARGHRLLALGLLLLTAAAIVSSVSGAAAMGLIAGLAMAALARLLPKRFGLALVGTGLGLALVLAPVEGDILARFMPEAIHARLEHSSSRARVAIARSFGAAVAADPWRGAGYGTSARFPEVPAAQGLAPELREMLAVGHPHNSFLQVWAELGILGAILAAAVLLLTLRAVAILPKAPFAVALGLIAAAAAIAFVEHGAWQAWWTAALGTAITWLRAGLARPPKSDTA